jgi:hypothetical protein
MIVAPAARFMGQSVARIEDGRHLTRRGRHGGGISLPDLVHGHPQPGIKLRAAHHARIARRTFPSEMVTRKRGRVTRTLVGRRIRSEKQLGALSNAEVMRAVRIASRTSPVCAPGRVYRTRRCRRLQRPCECERLDSNPRLSGHAQRRATSPTAATLASPARGENASGIQSAYRSLGAK